ncbi:MAG: Kef-type K+ transport system membrane component KefB [Paraglaciecola sp.]|jgi:Kef-type K+ transport system membrane component KefB
MLIFFVLAGASLDVTALQQITFIGVIYIMCRTLGKYCGVWLGSKISGIDGQSRNWMGLALLPQAGLKLWRFNFHNTVSYFCLWSLAEPLFLNLSVHR